VAYLVKLSGRAERDFASLYEEKDAEHSDAALEWYRGLKEAILSLGEHPKGCPQILEDARLRHLLYGNQQHVYRIQEKQRRVDVLHIRHGARRRMKAKRRI
jgi:plasmid stabilization system protein ParE